ncbi:MAG TPA: FAD-dependent oxidoreductase [Saprospiraceae bacterium]|nr:FAD-dependent oxidoreductase [Saprospiraceae bacterium]
MKILIAGQGIAGTMLADVLLRRGAQVRILDGSLPGSSTLPAAGIINPVTGKRFVKSWRLDEFFSVAHECYQTLERELGVPIWVPYPILRILGTPEETNDWAARCALPEYVEYLGESRDAGEWQPFIKQGAGYGVIRQAARAHFPNLITHFRKKMAAEGVFEARTVAYEEVPALSRDYDAIVFCEGFRAAENPFFPDLAWQVAKGEALLLRIPGADHVAGMLKKAMTVVPLGDGIFWAGGSYQWHYDDFLPTAGERDFILNKLNEMLGVPYEITGHVAGVRPTVKDRRPFLGASSIQSNVFIFNGLGTKGALLAPYWANHMADHLLQGTSLDPAVDIRRFAKQV